MNIDIEENKLVSNIVIKQGEIATAHCLEECKKFNEEFDAIVHLTENSVMDSIASETVFSSYEKAKL